MQCLLSMMLSLSIIWNFHFFSFLFSHFILFQLEAFLKDLVILAFLPIFMLRSFVRKLGSFTLHSSVTSQVILAWESLEVSLNTFFPHFSRAKSSGLLWRKHKPGCWHPRAGWKGEMGVLVSPLSPLSMISLSLNIIRLNFSVEYFSTLLWEWGMSNLIITAWEMGILEN